MIGSRTQLAGGAVLGVALLSGCHHHHHIDTAKIAATLAADVRGQAAAFNARNAAKDVSFDTPDWVGMMHGTANVVGAAGDLAQSRAGVSDPAMKLSIGDVHVDVARSGDLATTRTSYAYTYTDPKSKQPFTEHGNLVQEWKAQEGGGWKAAWEVVSDTPPPAS